MNKKMVRLARILLAAIMAAVAAVIIWKLLDYHKGTKDYSEAAKIALGSEEYGEAAEITPGAENSGEDAKPMQALASIRTEEKDEYAVMLAKLDLGALQEVNSDVIGWIAIPDTKVYYPVMQTVDNAYYLSHTWKKEQSSVGAVFLECKNPADFSGFHSILYGHQMRDGSMFGGLRNYADEAYLRAHPAIYLAVEEGVWKYDIFAVYEVGVEEIVYQQNLEEKGQQQELIDFATEHSVVNTGITPSINDRILTLSTCTGRGYKTRWVVQAARNKQEN